MLITTKDFTNKGEDDLYNIIYSQNAEQTHYLVNDIDNEDHRSIIDWQKKYIEKRLDLNKEYIKAINIEMISYLAYNDPNNEYKTFYIPKASGGKREINEPNPQLKELQNKALMILKSSYCFNATENAFAYISKRCCLDLAKKHKQSKYILKIDLKHFFNSITPELLKEKLSNLYAFDYIKSFQPDFLDNLIKISCKNNELPQGSPLSPILSNLLMIEFDYLLRRDVRIRNIIYTRYADDIIFSSQSYISKKIVLKCIEEILNNQYHNIIKINMDKVKTLTKNQKCYIVGVKLNKDNQLTYGHEKKKELKLQLYNIFKAKEFDVLIREEAQEVLGRLNYMSQIEPDYANYLVNKLMKQFKVNGTTIYKYFLGN